MNIETPLDSFSLSELETLNTKIDNIDTEAGYTRLDIEEISNSSNGLVDLNPNELSIMRSKINNEAVTKELSKLKKQIHRAIAKKAEIIYEEYHRLNITFKHISNILSMTDTYDLELSDLLDNYGQRLIHSDDDVFGWYVGGEYLTLRTFKSVDKAREIMKLQQDISNIEKSYELDSLYRQCGELIKTVLKKRKVSKDDILSILTTPKIMLDFMEEKNKEILEALTELNGRLEYSATNKLRYTGVLTELERFSKDTNSILVLLIFKRLIK